MKNFFFVFICFFFLSATLVSGQEKDDFERRYNEVYSARIAADVKDAYRIADSLFQSAKNDEQRIKTLMLLANIKHSIGDISMALKHVVKAQAIAELDGFAEWEARTSGFLATTYRNVGLLSESKKYLDKAEKANERQKDAKGYKLTKVNILQEKAFHAVEMNAHDAAIAFLIEAQHYLAADSSINPRARLVRATNNQLLGVSQLALGKLDTADVLFYAALNDLQGQESNLVPYVYRGLAEVSLKRGDYEDAKKFLDQAAPYIESSDREELKKLLYSSYIAYYDVVDKMQAASYRKLYQELSDQQAALTRQMANELLDEATAVEEKEKIRHLILTVFVLVLLLICIFLFLRMWFIRRRSVDTRETIAAVEGDDSISIVLEESYFSIAKETESRLLQRLLELEKSNFFLDPHMSLSKVASLMDTNQRYVSYMLKNWRGKDFNEFIQACRIDYIQACLATDAKLLECKISYIATLAGFSSHSQFLTAFKAETGQLPSIYIQDLRDRKIEGLS